MKKNIIFIIILILNLTFFLHSSDLKYYKDILKQLTNKKEIDDNIKLQLSLTKKIIDILKTKENFYSPKIDKIKNSNDFIEEFINVIQVYSNYLKNFEKLKEGNRKIDILDKQLLIIDNSSKNFLTAKLQHDFYAFSLKILNRKIEYINKNYTIWLEKFIKKINDIPFKAPSFDEKIKYLYNKLKKNLIKIEALKIEKERLQLINNTNSISKIDLRIDKLKRENCDTIKTIIKYYLFYFFYAFKNNNNQDFFKYKASIEKILNNYNCDIYFKNSIEYTLDKIIELKYGTKELIIHDTRKTFVKTIFYIFSLLKKPLFKINNKGISFIDIFFAFLIFFSGFYAGSLYKKYIVKLSYKGITLTQSTQTILSNIGYYLIIIISFFITLKVIGVNLSSLTVIIGALSVGIGFGLQSVISNFICGLILLFEKSIKVGDVIELDQNLIGKVKSINMRATVVNTFDNIEIIIPNQTLFQNNVINWTLSDDIRRLKIPFGVSYGTDIDKMESVILAELYESNLEFLRKDESKKPKIVFTNMDSSSINFELLVWVELTKVRTPQILASEFLKLIYKALNKHNIEIPFPQLDIHIKDIKDELKIKYSDNNDKNRKKAQQ